jgi:hypothetical protein
MSTMARRASPPASSTRCNPVAPYPSRHRLSNSGKPQAAMACVIGCVTTTALRDGSKAGWRKERCRSRTGPGTLVAGAQRKQRLDLVDRDDRRHACEDGGGQPRSVSSSPTMPEARPASSGSHACRCSRSAPDSRLARYCDWALWLGTLVLPCSHRGAGFTGATAPHPTVPSR